MALNQQEWMREGEMTRYFLPPQRESAPGRGFEAVDY